MQARQVRTKKKQQAHGFVTGSSNISTAGISTGKVFFFSAVIARCSINSDKKRHLDDHIQNDVVILPKSDLMLLIAKRRESSMLWGKTLLKLHLGQWETGGKRNNLIWDNHYWGQGNVVTLTRLVCVGSGRALSTGQSQREPTFPWKLSHLHVEFFIAKRLKCVRRGWGCGC